MEITYEITALYGPSASTKKDAQKDLETLFEESYVEEQEVMDIATTHDVVVLYETTESTGYSEVFLINNKGELEEMVTFSLDDIDMKREEIKNTSLKDVFDDRILTQIRTHIEEHQITEKVFLKEYLDELLLDNYEHEKEHLKQTIKSFYVK